MVKHEVDPPGINGGQIPLHRNESSQQKTLNFNNADTFVKKTATLSRERAIVYTQVCSDASIIQPEFIFKGKGIRRRWNIRLMTGFILCHPTLDLSSQ